MIGMLVVVILVTYIFYWYFSTREYRKKLSKFKSDPALPFIGHALKLGRSGNDQILSSIETMWHNHERDVFLLKLGPLIQIVITKPEDIELILSSNVLIEKSYLYKFLEPWVGNGLVNLTGNQWRMHRKMLTPAFHFKVLESYVDVFEEEAKSLVETLLSYGDDDIEVSEHTGRRALLTLCRTAIGFDINLDKTTDEFAESSQQVKILISQRMFSSWKFLDPIYKLTPDSKKLNECLNVIHTKVMNVLQTKKEEMKELIHSVSTGEKTLESMTTEGDFFMKHRMSFMELLLLSRKPDGQPMSNEEIENEVKTFMAAGHETIALSTAFLLYCLADNPEVQNSVLEEQLAITGGDLKKPVTYQSIQEMSYLERVIKESLRLYTTVPIIGRKITAPTVLKDGRELPLGSAVLLVPYLTHRNPDLFEDPLKFDPDRYLNHIKLYNFYPFSAGPRNCIGQKLAMVVMKCWMATIVRSVQLLPPRGPRPHNIMELTLNSSTGILVRAKRR